MSIKSDLTHHFNETIESMLELHGRLNALAKEKVNPTRKDVDDVREVKSLVRDAVCKLGSAEFVREENEWII